MDQQRNIRDRVTVDEIETLVGKLPGVLSARIVINDWGAIEEIHVLSTTERNPKQIVRDIESSLAAKWGLNIDHKKISVAQLSGPQLPSPIRLKILNVQVHNDTSRGVMQVKVTLGYMDENGEMVTYEGKAEGHNSRIQSIRTVSLATVESINHFILPTHMFAFEDATTVNLSGREIVVVSQVLISPRGNEEILIGAAPIKGDLLDAVIRANLDAANRRMSKLSIKNKGPEKSSEQKEPPA